MRHRDKTLLIDLLNKGATLIRDNDCCYVTDSEDNSYSFDFGPDGLVVIFCDHLGYKTELC